MEYDNPIEVLYRLEFRKKLFNIKTHDELKSYLWWVAYKLRDESTGVNDEIMIDVIRTVKRWTNANISDGVIRRQFRVAYTK